MTKVLYTQPFQPSDLRGGCLRIPVATKPAFPAEPCEIQVRLKGGKPITCSYTPRDYPDKSRSGLIRFRGPDKQTLLSQMQPLEQLKVSRYEDRGEVIFDLS